jgi:hypothetical protein
MEMPDANKKNSSPGFPARESFNSTQKNHSQHTIAKGDDLTGRA